MGTAIETNVNVIYKILNDTIEKGQKEKHGPAAPGEQMRSVITSEKLYNNFNWKPASTIKEGLEKTVEYFRNKS